MTLQDDKPPFTAFWFGNPGSKAEELLNSIICIQIVTMAIAWATIPHMMLPGIGRN